MVEKWAVEIYRVIEGTDNWPQVGRKVFDSEQAADEYLRDLASFEDYHSPGPFVTYDYTEYDNLES